MRTTTADYKAAIYATDRECRGYIKFNNDGTKIIRGVDGLISITLHEQLCDEERPMMNCACSRYVEVEFFNSGLPGGVSLANSYIDTYMGVVTKDTGTAPVGSIEPDTATVEYIWNGRFFITEIDRGKLSTKVLAYDELSKLNKQYVPTVTKGVSGYSKDDILVDILTQCGFTSTTAGVSGNVDELYECTCRQMFGWIMGTISLGSNVAMSRTNATNWGTRTITTGWNNRNNADREITDNEIYLGGLADGDTFTISSVTTGTADNPIVAGSGTGLVGENPYLTQANATTIYNNVNGISFKPMTIEFRGNPAIDTGDVLKVTSGGSSNYCYVQRLTTAFNGGIKQKIECFGDSAFYYSTELSPTNAQIKNAVSSMAQEIQQEIETADNGVITKVLDLDGSWKELVIANNQDLSAATSVWRWNINGLAHSTAYSGGTYNFAVDMNGRIIANMIQTGILTDANGYNSWNLDTGAFTITNGSINITTNSSTYDQIVLSYGEYKTTYSASTVSSVRTVGGSQRSKNSLASDYFYMFDSNNKFCVTLYNGTSESQQVPGQGTGYLQLYNNKVDYGYKPSISLNNFEQGHLSDLGSYHLNITSDSIGVFVGQGNGTSRGVMSLSASSNSQQFSFTDNATAIQTVRLDSSTVNHSGRLKLTNGTREYLLDTSGLSDQTGLIMYHDTSKLTAKIEPDSNGAGRLFLGDGTGTVNIVSLTNAGLTFRNSSNTVTATYPATGLQKLTGATDSSTASDSLFYIPNVTYTDIGVASTASWEAMAEGLFKWIATNYPHKTRCTFEGILQMNNYRKFSVYIYDTDVKQNGVPRYGGGSIELYTGQQFSIYVNNYVVGYYSTAPHPYMQDETSRNLVQLSMFRIDENYGVKISHQDGGTYKVTGTATAGFNITIGSAYLRAGVSYYLSGASGGGTTKAYLNIPSVANDTGSGSGAFTVTSDGTYNIRIIVASGASNLNLTFSPMVRVYANTPSSFVPWVPTPQSARLRYLPSSKATYLQNSGTASYELAQGVYLLSIGRWNTTTASMGGLYLISAYPNGSSFVKDISASSNASVSIASGGILTVTTTTNYCELSIIQLN